MKHLFECSDCGKIIKDDKLKVRFPNIPNLVERIHPGEPVPFGECPKCGALAHQASAIPGKAAYVSIVDGKFEVTVDGRTRSFSKRKPSLLSDDVEEVRQFLVFSRAETVMCSSSVDFPEEYGMSVEKARELFP